MRIAVTGTPGTGKTTVTERLASDLPIIHLNDVVSEYNLIASHDGDRDTAVVDMDGLETWLHDHAPQDVVIESHLAHHFDADRVVVLRAHPDAIATRLQERGERKASIDENAESEALDLILSEAVARHGEDCVYEIDTTDRAPADVAAEIDAVISGDREPEVGIVSFVDTL